MDSNRRHLLAQNFLANWFSTQYTEWIQPNLQWIGWLALALLVAIGAVFVSSKMKEWNAADFWEKYYIALQSEAPEENLGILADATSGTLGVQTRLSQAQLLLNEAGSLVSFDSEKAKVDLDKAIDAFQKSRSGATNLEQRQRSGFGLGQVYETLASTRTGKNDLEEAKKEYKSVVDLGADTFLGRKARKQLDLLEKPEIVKFYEQSAKAAMEKPKAEDFKVNIDKKDPFLNDPQGFDPQKVLEGSSALKGGLVDQKVDLDAVPASKEEKKEEKSAEKPKEDKQEEKKGEKTETP